MDQRGDSENTIMRNVMNNEGRTTQRCPIDQKLGGLAFGGREGPTHTFFFTHSILFWEKRNQAADSLCQ